MMKKAELRKVYKQKRQNLSLSDIQQLQKSIYVQIYDLDISTIKTIHIFLTLEKFKEIDTNPIINYFRSKKIKIVVSKSDFKNNTLTHFYLEKDTQIELNKYGIPEPKNAVQASEKAFIFNFLKDDPLTNIKVSDVLSYCKTLTKDIKIEDVIGHYDVSSKTCPNFNVKDFLHKYVLSEDTV